MNNPKFLPREKMAKLLGWLIPGIYLTFPIAFGLSNVLLAVVLLIFLFTFKREHFLKERWTAPMIWLMALWIMVVVGIFHTPATWDWVSIDLRKYSKMLFVLPIMLLLYRQPVWQNRSLHAFGIGMLFILLTTWLNIWVGLPWSHSNALGWGVSSHQMYDHIIQSLMMSLFVIYALTQADITEQMIRKATWRLLALLGVISITHLSQGRTGILVLVPALLVYVLNKWWGRRLFLALPILVLVVTFFISSSPLMTDRILQAQTEFLKEDKSSSIGHRLYNQKTTAALIAEKPILGHGTAAYHTEICRFLEKPTECAIYRWHPHNQYLLFAANYGLIGLCLYFALIGSLMKVGLGAINPSDRIVLLGLVGILVTDSLINSPLFSSKEAEFVLYMLALLVVKSKNQTHSRSEAASNILGS